MAMMTFYDFLEQFMFMGTIFESDQIKVVDDGSNEDDMFKSPDASKTVKNVEMV
jgi:hypothetical protein